MCLGTTSVGEAIAALDYLAFSLAELVPPDDDLEQSLHVPEFLQSSGLEVDQVGLVPLVVCLPHAGW